MIDGNIAKQKQKISIKRGKSIITIYKFPMICETTRENENSKPPGVGVLIESNNT
jgi:hypothetical protein